MANLSRYFDPHTIAQLKRLEIRSRRVVEGVMLGLHKSPFRGVSVEFAEHRPYVMGDSIRHIDWKVYAKSDRYYVKEYEKHTNMRIIFAVDASESMFYQGGAPMNKYDYACTIVGTMAYLLLNQQDAAGLTIFDKDVRTAMPPRGTPTNYYNMLHTLESASPGSATMIGGTLSKIASQMKRRGLVIIMSDFLDDLEPVAQGLSQLSFGGHDVICFYVNDPWEKEFPFRGPSILEGLENAGRLLCDPSDLRETYIRNRNAHLNELITVCRKLRFDVEETITSEPFDQPIGTLLGNRLKLARY